MIKWYYFVDRTEVFCLKMIILINEHSNFFLSFSNNIFLCCFCLGCRSSILVVTYCWWIQPLRVRSSGVGGGEGTGVEGSEARRRCDARRLRLVTSGSWRWQQRWSSIVAPTKNYIPRLSECSFEGSTLVSVWSCEIGVDRTQPVAIRRAALETTHKRGGQVKGIGLIFCL